MKYLLINFLLICFASYGQDVKFYGKTDKKFDGYKVHLYNRITNDRDSATIKDGKFAITVKYKEPTRYFFYSEYQLKTKGGYSPYGIVITEPCIVKIDAAMENFSDSKVKGLKENELYNSFTSESSKAQKKIIDDLTLKYGAEFINNRKPDTSDAKYKQLMQDYKQMSEANQKIESANLVKFIYANPNSFAAVNLLDGYARTMELSDVENLYDALSSKYKDSRNGKSIEKGIEARKITAIGKIAPDFAQPDTLGKIVKLSDFRGKYLLVDFWASWCGPCRAENPNLVKTFSKYKEKGFAILGVSLDQPGKQEAWLGAIHKDGLSWTQVSDLKFWENEVAILYGVKAIPTNLLLDKEGKIIAKDLRGADLEKKLSEVVGL